MKILASILTIVFASLSLLSCNNNEELQFFEITAEDFFEATDGRFYEINDWNALRYKQGKWTETTPDQKSEKGELGMNTISSVTLTGFQHPSYLWIKDNDAYTRYEPYWNGLAIDDFSWREIFYPYLEDGISNLDDYDPVWLFVANELQIDKGNRFVLSSRYYADVQGEGFRFVLEEASTTRIVIRIEFPRQRLKCEGIRLTYKVRADMPIHSADFDTQEELEGFIHSVIAKNKG